MTESTGGLLGEDAKLVTLARFAIGRTGPAEAAAVRDLDGRTYTGVSVDLPSLQVSALQVCVAAAVTSSSRGLEAALLLGPGDKLRDEDVAVVRDFGGEGVPVHRCAESGSLILTVVT